MARRALKVCACIGCPAHPGSCPNLCETGRCPRCARTADHARGTRQARGYNAEHDRLRASWKPKVEAGRVDCARCRQRIHPGQAWDLGHTVDRRGWTGPEHATCNRAAGGRAAHQ